MKKILIAAMVFATAALVGCEQFLQEDPAFLVQPHISRYHIGNVIAVGNFL